MAFCLCMISFADNGGLFQRGETLNEKEVPMLQSVQRNTNDDAKDEAPLSGGVLLLTALGTAYAISKKHKQ